jgi:aminoglycoside 6-adenylyltransferase
MALLQQIERSFVAWAESNDDVRAAFVVGSQARVDHPADEWADLDIILFAHHLERYQERMDWIEQLAPVWIAIAGRTVAGDPERLVLFEGDVQVDFVFNHPELLRGARQMVAADALPETLRRGVRVLLDKDGLIPPLPAPRKPPAQTPPSEAEFRQCLEGFWFGAVHCAKQLCRQDLWTFQHGSGGMLSHLLRVVEWHARVLHGWDYDTWHGGKFIAEWAGADVAATLRHVFARLDVEDGWQAMEARLDLFHRLAREVAVRLDYAYPAGLEADIAGCVEALRRA